LQLQVVPRRQSSPRRRRQSSTGCSPSRSQFRCRSRCPLEPSPRGAHYRARGARASVLPFHPRPARLRLARIDVDKVPVIDPNATRRSWLSLIAYPSISQDVRARKTGISPATVMLL